jgi:hypothetical protein
MSQDAMAKIIERASTDESFRTQLRSNPEGALSGYELTPEERAAVLSGDSGQMRSLGVDSRVTKLDNPPGPGEAADWNNGPFGD